MATVKKTVSVHALIQGVACRTSAKMEIEAQFIGHLLVEVCGPDGHAAAPGVAYAIEGPGGKFSGKTDSAGRLRHEDVTAGDYVLTFTDHEELPRVIATTARKDAWQRTTVSTPREQLPPKPPRPTLD